MMKNMDWGAIAYLTQSKYRKEGEVWANSNTAYKTGCAGSSVSATNESICNEYYTELGQNASTTGNIYGIYDMSGGIHEYVMGGMYNLDEITILVKSSGFNQTTIDSIDMQKYINKYAYGTTDNDQTSYNRRQLGDGTGEVRGWNGDYTYFVYLDYPWFVRGGNRSTGAPAGMFNFDRYTGFSHALYSFLIVVF